MSATAALTNSATITGGAGGLAGYGQGNGGGGGGGAGITTTSNVTNTGTVIGGSGSALQSAVTGGGGGAGIFVSGNGATVTLTNSGTISGGTGTYNLATGYGPGWGGAGEGGAEGATATTYADGGAAIVGTNVVINNYGTLNGGMGLGDNTRYYALDFTAGSANQLNLYSGSVINGGLILRSGNLEIVERAGARTFSNAIETYGATTFNTNGFDFSSTGIISGTGSVNKTGNGTLTLSGANSYSGGTTISAGTLSVSNDSNLGATTGSLSISNATLQTSASFTTARSVYLSATGATIAPDSGKTLTVSGVIANATASTPSALNKNGAGTLALSGTNTFTGQTTINQGTLSLSGNGSIAKSSKVDVESGSFDISATTTGASVTSLTGTSNGTVALG
ncbi:autotransporter-associated beta strand repeat-containing protein, partial [Buttiauxella gaviniae]|uniref:autotransporter-associated beta strand repeat-containing protein n=1 Tax=Buttiauxella gaviniae TaxID=82990 RepID=UPI001AE04E87